MEANAGIAAENGFCHLAFGNFELIFLMREPDQLMLNKTYWMRDKRR
jgi:hypothetical protein